LGGAPQFTARKVRLARAAAPLAWCDEAVDQSRLLGRAGDGISLSADGSVHAIVQLQREVCKH
jgi:hypothetical protein